MSRSVGGLTPPQLAAYDLDTYLRRKPSWHKPVVVAASTAKPIVTAKAYYEPTDDEVWRLLEEAATVARRVLIYGPPGTGKSHMARTVGLKPGQRVHPVPIHEDLPAAELRGHFITTKHGMEWRDGPAVAAWRDGGRLVLDEIDKLSADGMSLLLSILDDEATATIELGTTGEILAPDTNLTIWATMNGMPRDLPDPLLDRFVIRAHVQSPHPDAIAALPEDLRAAATALCTIKDSARRIGLRAFMEFSRLREPLGDEKAAFLTFGDKWPSVQEQMVLARAMDIR